MQKRYPIILAHLAPAPFFEKLRTEPGIAPRQIAHQRTERCVDVGRSFDHRSIRLDAHVAHGASVGSELHFAFFPHQVAQPQQHAVFGGLEFIGLEDLRVAN